MHWLEMRLEDDLLPVVQRRAQTILYHGLGLTGRAIAQALQVHFNTSYADLHAFARAGLAGVRALSVGGAPQRISEKQLAAIWHWADCSPREVGLLDARWTLASFREFLVKRQRVLTRISLEHLRRLLKKRIFAFGARNANSLAAIPSAQRF
jgi:transposase